MSSMDFFKEFKMPFGPARLMQFEFKDSAEGRMKYLVPGLAYTRCPKICFAVVFYIWDKRGLIRFVLDRDRAEPKFPFK